MVVKLSRPSKVIWFSKRCRYPAVCWTPSFGANAKNRPYPPRIAVLSSSLNAKPVRGARLFESTG